MSNFAQQLGKKIKLMRVTKDTSQEELSFNAGCDQSYLSRVERGDINITVKKLNDIALALECKLTELIPEEQD